MNQFQKEFITLIRYALSDDEVCPDISPDFNYRLAFMLAEQQQVTPLLYYGASKTTAFLSSPDMPMMFSKTCEYISLSENQMNEYTKVAARFETAGVDYAPVKGIVTKNIYPQPDMRLMGDCDILIRSEQYEIIESVMKELGYSPEIGEGDEGHEYTFTGETGVEFELHHHLIPEFEKDLYTYFGDGWKCQKKMPDSQHRYEMSHEDAFIYSFGHFVKHYRLHGAGLKYVLDFYRYMIEYPNLDMTYIRNELTKLNLSAFFDNILRVIDVWFSDAESDEVTDFLTDKVMYESSFGSEENGVVSQALREEENVRVKHEKDAKQDVNVGRVKRRRWLHNIFLPYSDMRIKYPILIHWAILLPLFWFIRIVSVVFFHRDRLKQNATAMNQTLSKDRLEKYRSELNLVGLDYNYDEFETEWNEMMKEKKKKSRTNCRADTV